MHGCLIDAATTKREYNMKRHVKHSFRVQFDARFPFIVSPRGFFKFAIFKSRSIIVVSATGLQQDVYSTYLLWLRFDLNL